MLTINGFISGVMVSMLASSEVDHGFIGGVMVSVLTSREVDHGFIGGVMVSMLTSREVDHGFIGGRSSPVTTLACYAYGEWMSDCCLTPTQKLFSYLIARTS
jgi:hypothetical protein